MMYEEIAIATTVIVTVLAIAIASTVIAVMAMVTNSANWQTCIEAGHQMVNGVCL